MRAFLPLISGVLLLGLVGAMPVSAQTPASTAALQSAPVSAPTADAGTPPGDAEAAAPTRELEWYTAEVPVRSQESRERDAALGRALAQVVIRVTGRVGSTNNPVVQKALRVPETVLLGTEYRDVEEMAGGVPVQRQVLAASFDPEAVDALVMAAGLPLWVGERPRPMLWLAIDDGGGAGPRLVSAQQINVVRPLALRGLERGLRFLLPAGNAIEQPAAARIWALDPAAMSVLSGRYGASKQLLGKLSRAPGGWQAEWLLADGASELKRWSVTDASPQRAIASGADAAADLLAARQSRMIEAGEPEVVDAEIVGIDSQDRWLGLAAYLQSLPVLRSHQIIEAQPGRVRVRLDLAVDRARFEAMLAGGGRLAVLPMDAGEPADALAPVGATTIDDAAAPSARYRVLP